MTEAQLRALLFTPKQDGSFFQSTSDYMSTLTQTESQLVTNLSAVLQAETNEQDQLTQLTQEQTDKVNNAYQEQADMQPHSMPSWLSDVLSVFMFLVSVVTLDPVMIGISGSAMVMQVSGLQKQMVDAVSHGDTNIAAAFEFGMGIGEAMAAGGLSAIRTATEEIPAELANLTSARRFVKNTLAYSGQTLLQNNFWSDFFQGPCGMDETGAMILGMVVGLGGAVGTSFLSEEGGLAKALKAGFDKAFKNPEKVLQMYSLLIGLATSGFQVGASVEQIKIGKEYEKLASFEKDVLAPADGQLALFQGIEAAAMMAASSTQDTMSTLLDATADEVQTFRALGAMYSNIQG